MKSGLSNLGRIIISVLILASLFALVFGGVWLNYIGASSDDIMPDGLQENLYSRASPTLNVQDQTTLVDRELNIRKLISAYDADGRDISNDIIITGDDSVYNAENDVFKASKAGKYTLILSVTDAFEHAAEDDYIATTTKKMNILVDNSVGQYTITIVSVNNGTLLTNMRLAKAGTVVKLNPQPHTGYQLSNVVIECVNNSELNVEMPSLEEFVMPESDVIVTPTWSPVDVTVLLNANGGGIEGDTVFSKTYNEPYGTLPIPTRNGYDFVGWSLVRVDGATLGNDAIVLTPNAHYLYAQWIPSAFSISFDANEGSLSDSSNIYIKYGQQITDLPIPTREGYSFSGWLIKDTDSYLYNGSKFTYLSNLTLVAQWQPSTGFVNFDPNGGTVSIDRIKVYYNNEYGNLPTPSRSGYTFLGWFTSKTGGSEIKSSDIVNSIDAITLYAHWQIETYKTSFDAVLGTFTDISGNPSLIVTQTEYLGEIVFPQSDPEHLNEDFLGWFTSAVGGTKVIPGQIYQYTADKTFYAHWDTAKYTVTFDALGGNVSIPQMIVTYGTPYGSLPVPTRVGYIFEGWYTEESGGTLVSSSTMLTTESDHTLYARWKARTYNITFVGEEDATLPAGITCSYNSIIPELGEPSRPGYVFIAWYDELGNQVRTGDIYSYATDLVLRPEWEACSIILVRNSDAAAALAASDNSNGDLITFVKTTPVNYNGTNVWLVYDKSNSLGVTNDGNMTPYTGNENILAVIPSAEITDIADNAFKDCINLVDFTWTDKLVNIGSYSFANSALSGVLTIKNTIETIGEGAFQSCNNLTAVTFEEDPSIKTIEANTFYGCSGLRGNCVIPEGITKIGANAFASSYRTDDNHPLSIISLPSTLVDIGPAAFSNTGFTSELNLSSCLNLKSIGDGAFENSTITSLTLPNSVLDSFALGKSTFKGSSIANTMLYIPEYVTTLPQSVFENCTKLIGVTISDCAEAYEPSVFSGCTSLREVKMPCNVKLSENMFTNTTIEKLTLSPGTTHSDIYNTFAGPSDVLNYRAETAPANVSKRIKGYTEISFNSNAQPWANTLKSAVIEDGVFCLDAYVLYNCSLLTDLTLPVDCNVLQSYYVCSNCSKSFDWYTTANSNILTSISQPIICPHCNASTSRNLVYFTTTFSGVNSLQNLTLTPGVSNSSYYQYYGSDSSQVPAFASYTDALGITHINQSLQTAMPWSSSSSLKTLIIKPGVSHLADGFFYDATALTNITMPGNLIPGDSTFDGCESVENVVITTGVDFDGNIITETYNYSSAVNLDGTLSYDDTPWSDSTKSLSVKFESGITKIGDHTLDFPKTTSHYKVKELIIPDTVTSLGAKTFNDLPLDNCIITLPVSLDFSPLNAILTTVFSGSVSSVTLTPGTNAIVDYTNSNYTVLPWSASTTSYSLTIQPGVVHIPAYMFYNGNINGAITIPDTVTSIGENAFGSSAATAAAVTTYSLRNTNADLSISVPAGLDFSSAFEGANVSNLTITNASGEYSGELIPKYLATTLRRLTLVSSEENPVTSVNHFAQNFPYLTTVAVPETVTRAGDYAFSGVPSLRTINGKTVNDFIASLESVGDSAFYNANISGELIIPSTLKDFEDTSFAYNPNLTGVTLVGNHENYISEGGILYGNNGKKLILMPIALMSDINQPRVIDFVDSIGSLALAGTKSSSLTIPENVVMDEGALFGITTSNLTLPIGNMSESDVNPFVYNNGKAEEQSSKPTRIYSIIYTAGLDGRGDGVNYLINDNNYNLPWLTYTTDIVLSNGIKTLPKYFLYNASDKVILTIDCDLTSVIDDDGSVIEPFINSDYTEKGYPNIATVNIGANVSVIHPLFFRNFQSLAEFIVDTNNNSYTAYNGILVKELPSGGFEVIKYPAAKLTETLSLEDSHIKRLGEYSLAYSPKLTNVTIGSNIKVLKEYAFAYCDNLVKVVIPANLNLAVKGLFESSPIIYFELTGNGNTADYSRDDAIFLPWSNKEASITIGDGISHIGSYLFFYLPVNSTLNWKIDANDTHTIDETTFSLHPNFFSQNLITYNS